MFCPTSHLHLSPRLKCWLVTGEGDKALVDIWLYLLSQGGLVRSVKSSSWSSHRSHGLGFGSGSDGWGDWWQQRYEARQLTETTTIDQDIADSDLDLRSGSASAGSCIKTLKNHLAVVRPHWRCCSCWAPWCPAGSSSCDPPLSLLGPEHNHKHCQQSQHRNRTFQHSGSWKKQSVSC